jgi:hypothetical protein
MFYQILTEFGFSQNIFIKVPNLRFLRRSVQWDPRWYIHMDGQTDTTRVIGAFLFATTRERLKLRGITLCLSKFYRGFGFATKF